MASNQILVLFAIIAVILPHAALAKEVVVGDDQGWKLDFNYTVWAMGKEFNVGDTLVFNYNPSFHNVIKVSNPVDFKACNVTSSNQPPLTSGSDVITLATPGKKWYICGASNHCSLGQKLVITVLATSSQTPAPAPTTSSGVAVSSFPALVVAAFTIMMRVFA